MKLGRTLIGLVAVSTSLMTSVAVAQAPPPPGNDNYLQSFALNQPGQRLERNDTLKDVQNTTSATVQGDMFSPPQSGGPAEPVQCGSTRYGKTIWYDFYPDVSGLARIRASGFNTVVNVMPFNRQTFQPSVAAGQCADGSSSTTEEFLVQVARGRAYTIQLGGVADAGGNLEFLFDFLADTDSDGVLDDVDKCDRLKGTEQEAGCPTRLRADATLRARPTANGIQLLGLSVTAPRGSRVAVDCSRGCGRQVKRARSEVRFGALRGRRLSAGSSLVIRVTKRRAIGVYVKYRISAGNFRKTQRCLNPGSRKPRRRCG